MTLGSKILAFLSYGEGPHINETVFSILSAVHWLKGNETVKIVVMTDTPHHYAGLGVEIDHLSEATLQNWLGHGNYIHRRKPAAMKYALSSYGGSVALVDGDTWFRQSPAALFDRIKPKICCLHMQESKLVDSGTPTNRALADFLRDTEFRTRDGSVFRIKQNSSMWNSGVIGLHCSDIDKIDDALHLLDQLTPCVQTVHTIEQFAISHALMSLRINEASDVVFHYWPQRMRARFREIVGDVLTSTAALPITDRWGAAYAMRPKASPKRKIILAIKRSMQLVGLPVMGVRASG